MAPPPEPPPLLVVAMKRALTRGTPRKWLALLALMTATADCRCPRGDASRASVDVEGADADFDLATPADAEVLPRCTLGPSTPLARRTQRDGGLGEGRFEAVTARAGSDADLAALVDGESRTLSVLRLGGPSWTAPVGPTAVQALALASLGRSALVLTVSEERGGRVQRAYVAAGQGGTLALRATHTGSLEDGCRVVAAQVRGGVLSAWDETPSGRRGIVRVQRWTEVVSADPPSAIVSAPEHDASDPVLAGLPDGGALLAYLSVRNVTSARETANQSTADVVVRALSPEGVPLGAPVALTPVPRMRFGVALHGTSAGRWAAWRVAVDSDHEGLGDGGQIAVVSLGEDLRPVREPAYASERGAVPTGAIAWVSEGATAEVYWVERRGDALMTVRRAVGRDGRLEGPARDEPALGGSLPFGGSARAPRVLLTGPDDGTDDPPRIAAARCP
jgi:hypothetical protein